MKFILLILSLFSFSLCQYTQLKKHSSVKVKPGTKVYLDLSSFEIGELISFEIEMDLFFGGNTKAYEFFIDQVPASSYYDPNYWITLRKVRNGNASCDDSRDCIFEWEEIKKEGNTYIYIILPAPASFWDEKIKIKNLGGGLSSGAIVGIVFGVIAFIAIFVVLISCCCCVCQQNNGCCFCCRCCDCCCCKKRYFGTTIQASIPFQQPVYPTPVPVPVPVTPVPVTPVTPAYQNPGPVYPVTGQAYPQEYPKSQPYTSIPGYG